MSWLISKLYDPFMRGTEEACLADWRESLLEAAVGDVLEVGAGTGLNLEYYRPSVDTLTIVEPDTHMLGELDSRLGESPLTPKIIEGVAESLPFADATFDTVVSTLVLCSVQDVDEALAEYRRVLRPGGAYIFIEHVAAENNPGRLKWQRRIEPVWKFLADNCHLTRHTERRIRSAGFDIEEIQRESMRKALPFVRPTIWGRARAN